MDKTKEEYIVDLKSNIEGLREQAERTRKSYNSVLEADYLASNLHFEKHLNRLQDSLNWLETCASYLNI